MTTPKRSAGTAATLLGLRPAWLAEILKREVGYQHRLMSQQAVTPEGPELSGLRLEYVSQLLGLIGALESVAEEMREREVKGGSGTEEANRSESPEGATATAPSPQQSTGAAGS